MYKINWGLKDDNLFLESTYDNKKDINQNKWNNFNKKKLKKMYSHSLY